MATVGQLRLWDETSQVSRNFALETKLIDFGDMYSRKSISGLILSFTENSTSNSPVWISVFYRQKLKDNWLPLTTFSNYNSSTSSTVKVQFPPIKNLENIQLRIVCPYSGGDFGINDIGLIYRTYRESTTSNFDE